MLKIWTRCEKTGFGADVEVARRPSRSFRSASRMVDNSAEGDGAGPVTVWPVNGCAKSCWNEPGARAGVEPAGLTGACLKGYVPEGCPSSRDSEAKALSRYFECRLQNCM